MPTITRQPFCDKLSPAEVAATGGDKKPAKLVINRKPGDKFSILDTQQVEVNWYGYWESEQTGYDLRIAKKATTAAEIETRTRAVETSSSKGPGTCTTLDVTGFGDVTYGLSCSRKEGSDKGTFYSGFAKASYLGLFGDTAVYCQVSSADAANITRVEAPVADFCELSLEAISQ